MTGSHPLSVNLAMARVSRDRSDHTVEPATVCTNLLGCSPARIGPVAMSFPEPIRLAASDRVVTPRGILAAGGRGSDIMSLLASNQCTGAAGDRLKQKFVALPGRAQRKGGPRPADPRAKKSSLEREVKQDHWTLAEPRALFDHECRRQPMSRSHKPHRCQPFDRRLSFGEQMDRNASQVSPA